MAMRVLVLLFAAIGSASHESCDCEAECASLLREQREEIVRLHAQIRELRSLGCGTSPVAAATPPAATPPSAQSAQSAHFEPPERRAAATPPRAPSCDDDVVELRSDDDVAALEGCAAVRELLIHGGEVGTLAALQRLEAAVEIRIVGTGSPEDRLSSLAGLGSLKGVERDLAIRHNTRLVNAAGLESLTRVGGTLSVEGNAGLRTLSGLQSLQSIGNLTVLSNRRLRNLSGLDNLVSLPGHIDIRDNNKLKSLAGLQSLQTAADVRIEANHDLVSLSGLKNLTYVRRAVKLHNNRGLVSISALRSLSHVRDLTITKNDRLVSLTPLESLASVRGDVAIGECFALHGLEGLHNLASVGGHLIIGALLGGPVLEGLRKLRSVGGDVRILMAISRSLGGPPNLRSIGGDLIITLSGALVSLEGLGSLESVGGDILIDFNPALASLKGLDSLTRVRGNIVITENHGLETLEGLGNLAGVTGDVRVVLNRKLRSLKGLESLQTARSLKIIARTLPSIAPLQGLRSVECDVDIETCGLDSLYGLGRLRSASGVRVRRVDPNPPGRLKVQNFVCPDLLPYFEGNVSSRPPPSPMRVLGGPLAAGASVGLLSIDEQFWPLCVTPQEHRALVSAVSNANMSSIPEPRWCNFSLARCTKGHPCNFSIGGGVPGSVFISGLATGCGACREDVRSKVAVTGEVDFGRALRDEVAGLHSVCLCGTSDDPERHGPVGQLALRGARDSGETHCYRGRNCTVKLDGEALEHTDRVVLMSANCREGDPLLGFPASWSAENEYLLHDPVRWYAAPPRSYQVCWRAPCSLTVDGPSCPAPEDSYSHAGVVVLRGPFPRDQTRVLGEDNLTALNIGIGVGDGDRMRLLRACGEANKDALGVPEAESQGLLFDFGTLVEGRVGAGSHHLCWCQSGTGCDAERDFTAESGAVQILCPAGQEFVSSSRRCQECPAGRQQLKAGLEPCSECPTGQFSTGGARGCEPCQLGAIAELTGSSACVACQAWESANVAATDCSPDPGSLVLFAAFQLSVGALCVVLVRTLRRRLSVVDVSLERGCTVLTSLGPHGFSNFGRPSFPATLHGTGHPGLDSPSEPLRARVKDTARLELLGWQGKSISRTRLDTSMGTLVLAFPHDLYHHGWLVPAVVSLPVLFVTVVTFAGLLLATDMAVGAFLVAAATALVCTAASVAMRRRHARAATPLTRRLSEFKLKLAEEHTIAVSCQKGPDRAITAGKLHALLGFFREFIRDRTAYHLTSNILMPVTKEAQLSYAEFVGPGQVEWFVSHFWGTAYEHFCTALRKHGESVCGEGWQQLQYWVCFCSNNQHRIEEELGAGWQESSFYITLRSGHCKGTCMVLDDTALPLTRVWCIFELMQTVKLQRSSTNFQGLLFCTSSGLLNTGSGSVEVALALAKRVADMDLETAEASNKSDKTMIQAQVVAEMGSFAALNRFVCAAIRDMLVRARQNTDGQFDRVLGHVPPALVDG